MAFQWMPLTIAARMAQGVVGVFTGLKTKQHHIHCNVRINNLIKTLKRRRLVISLQIFFLLATPLLAKAASITWTNTAGGDWKAPANWQPNQVPGATDTALIITAGSYNVSVSDNESVSNLVLGAASGTLTLNILGGTFTVNGNGIDSAHSALVISGGTVTGPGSIVAGGPLTWTGGNINGTVTANGGSINVPAGSTVGNGGALINTGTLTWTPNSGPRTGGGTVISNAPSGVINVTLNGNNIDSYVYGGVAGFYNAGTINVTGSGQSASITDPFFNTGTVNVNSGTLSLADGGINSGTINAASGADLDFSGGTFTNTYGSLIAGAGNLSDSGSGTYSFGGPLNLGGSWTFGGNATVNLTGSTTTSSNTVNVSGSTVNFNGAGKGGTWQPAAVNLSNGTLGGSTPVVVAGPLTWTGGNIYGLLSVDGGSINVSAGSTVGNGGELINTGPLAWTPNSGPRTGGGTVISNSPSGVISVTLNGNNIDSFVYGGAAAFYNAGTINVSGSGQSGFITDPFFNTGTLNVNSGTLSLNDGGTNSNGFVVAAGATLALAGNTYNFSSGSTLTGAGTNNFSSGTVNFLGDATVSGAIWLISGANVNLNGSGSISPTLLLLNNGLLAGSDPLLVAGPLAWTGGSINGLVSANGGSINVSAGSTVGNGGELINTGLLAWTPNSGPRTGGGTVISNAPSGVISVVLNGSTIDSYVYGGAAAFYNAGTINVTGSGQSGSITDPFFNTGTVNVNSGTLSLADGGINSGTINAASGADLDFSGGTFTNTAGSLIAGAGNLSNSGSGTYSFGGPLNLGGSWTFGGSATVNLSGSTTTSGNTINLSGSTVNFNGAGKGGSWQPGAVNLSNGTLGGSTPVLAAGPLTWSGGSIYGTLSANGGSINVSAGSTVGNGGELINAGPLTWTPNSGPRTGGGTVISNAPSGVISVVLNGSTIDSYVYGGAAAFYNAGTINVSGSGQNGSITDPFFNTGTVNVNGGTLSLADGGINSGIINTASGADLDFSGGTFTNTASSLIAGAGNLSNSGSGTYSFGGPLNLGGSWTFGGSATVNLSGSTTTSGNTINLSGSTVNFNGTGKGGSWQPGAVNFSNGTLGGSTPVLAAGPLTWTGGNIYGTLGANGGSINVSASSWLGNGGEFINTGPLTWTPNSGPRTGGGTVISNAPNGVINVALNGNTIDSYVYGGAAAFYNAGTINVTGSGQSGSITDPFFNSGTLNVNSGTLSILGGYSPSNGTLNFGLNSATNFGRLTVSGIFPINGTLDVTANGYIPQVGDSFPLITYGSMTGAFTSFHLMSGINWQQTYGPTAYTLSVGLPLNFALAIGQPPWTADGFNLAISGPVGSNYTVFVTTDLTQNKWLALSNFVSVFTTTPITDTSASKSDTNRFYRLYLH